jgi:hypothetical protein
MRFVALACALVLAIPGPDAQAPSSGQTLVDHEFTTSAKGWLVSGDTGPVVPEFHRDGGHPGGYISNVDEAVGETWYFRAPGSLLNRLRAAENGTLSYSLQQSVDGPGFVDDDIVIQGPSGRLSYRFERTPGTEWSRFSVRLTTTAGWRWNWNAQPTSDEMRSVLVNATSLEIRGEYHTGPDVGGLDSVVLETEN